MATGWGPTDLTDDELADGEAYHRALYHDADLERPAGWHRDSFAQLLKLARPHIKEGSLVVDYGSGAGGSAIELLKVLDREGVAVDLVLVDPLASWFAKAHEILGEREDVHFELSLDIRDGKTVFRRLDEMLGGRRADVILSASTLHLVPVKALPDLAGQFAECLAPGGAFVWDSGDVDSPMRPASAALLHDPYRAVREILRKDDARQAVLAEMAAEDAARAERRIDRIFPVSFSVDVLREAFNSVGFGGSISDHVIGFANDDAERFILVPRLAQIAAPLIVGGGRNTAIRETIQFVLARMRAAGTASSDEYHSHWVYGYHTLP